MELAANSEFSKPYINLNLTWHALEGASIKSKSLRIQNLPDRRGFFGLQSHPKRIGINRGNPFLSTEMTSIFEGQPPKTRPFPIKTRVIWVLGTWILRENLNVLDVTIFGNTLDTFHPQDVLIKTWNALLNPPFPHQTFQVGTEPYKAILGVDFPLHMPYILLI